MGNGQWARGNGLSLCVGLAIAQCLLPVAAAAQVGHDPARSPFRDIPTRQSITFFGGHFGGHTAEAGVGAQSGQIFGVRIRARLSGPIDLMANVATINSQRIVIDPTQPVASRVSGPIDYRLLEADLGLLVTLTGAKTWHGLAPYLGAGLGITTPTDSRVDPGGYRAKTNFTIAPTIGVRWHPGRRFAVSFEARDNTIRYEWPLSYFQPRDANNNALPFVLDPDRYDSHDLTHNLTLSIGLSWLFNF